MKHRPALTLGDRRRVGNLVHMADRKKLPDTRGLAPARRPTSAGFLIGFMFGFASCAVVLAFALSLA